MKVQQTDTVQPRIQRPDQAAGFGRRTQQTDAAEGHSRRMQTDGCDGWVQQTNMVYMAVTAQTAEATDLCVQTQVVNL